MAAYRILTANPYSTNTHLAPQPGRQVWAEGEWQLDFSGIRSVARGFAIKLGKTIRQQREPALIYNAGNPAWPNWPSAWVSMVRRRRY